MGAYISWDVTEDQVFDDEGNEIGADEYVLIERIYVPADQRRKGLARKLLRDAIAEAKRQYPMLTIKIAALPFGDDHIDMSALVDFYESEGFAVIDCNGHAVIMEM